jgi:hypothetical protein
MRAALRTISSVRFNCSGRAYAAASVPPSLPYSRGLATEIHDPDPVHRAKITRKDAELRKRHEVRAPFTPLPLFHSAV